GFAESAAGLIGGALNYVFRFGVRVMATDSATIDMPIALMTERFVKGDKAAYFPIHRAGRLTEWTHAEKLTNLGSLPGPFGYKFMFFPVKIFRGTGAWIRAVAIEDEWLNTHRIQIVDLSLPIMNHSFEPGEAISAADLMGKLERIGYRLKNQDIVLIRTGAAEHFTDDPNFSDLSIRLERNALLWLLDQGIRVIGCDCESLDGPVTPMVDA